MSGFWRVLPVVAMLTAMSCGDSTPGSYTETDAKEDGDEQQRTQEEPPTLSAYTFEQKDALVSDVQEDLVEVDSTLDTLRSKVEQSTEGMKEGLQESLARLEDKRVEVIEALAQMTIATMETWATTREHLESGLTELKKGCQELASRIG